MNFKKEFKTIGTAAVVGGILVYQCWSRMTKFTEVLNENKAVLITGCDSGIGYSFARFCLDKGITVFACVLDPASPGAVELSQHSQNVYIYQLDVRDNEIIKKVAEQVTTTVADKSYDLLAIVNNAGVLVFGEFEWHTLDQITEVFDVNLLGALRVAKAFLPLIRKHKGRIINVTSHCSKVALPSLSIYSASKAALMSWSSALRMELERFDVKVITFTPGSYATESKIMSRQPERMKEMQKEMTDDIRKAYGHFEAFHAYLGNVASNSKSIGQIKDPALLKKFGHAVFSKYPNRDYVHEPLRYSIYHLLFAISLTGRIREYFIKRFVSLPQY